MLGGLIVLMLSNTPMTAFTLLSDGSPRIKSHEDKFATINFTSSLYPIHSRFTVAVLLMDAFDPLIALFRMMGSGKSVVGILNVAQKLADMRSPPSVYWSTSAFAL